jgi:very-short-patch-repair endonuclease
MSHFTAADLRKNLTVPEKKLWEYLRAHRCLGFKFRRQHPIGRTIVDFVCLKNKLVVELDGSVHDNQIAYDLRRDAWLRSQGYRVLRFTNEEFEQDAAKVVAKIKAVLEF